MEFVTKAALINIFGDEFGVGEAWDLYEMYSNYTMFKKAAVYVVSAFLGAIGIICLIVGFYENNNKIFLGIGGFTIGLALIMILAAVVYHMHHKKKQGSSSGLVGSLGDTLSTVKSGLHTLSNVKKHGVMGLIH